MNLVLNFGHPLGARSAKFLQERLREFAYVHHRLKIDFDKPLLPQVVKAVDAVEGSSFGRTSGLGLEGSVIYLVSPGLTDPAVLLIVEIFGRTGFFPNLLLMRRDDRDYVIYDIIDGDKAKLQARGRRKKQTSLEDLCGKTTGGATQP